MIEKQIEYCNNNGVEYHIVNNKLCVKQDIRHHHLTALANISDNYKKVEYGYVQK